jgi:hypothetical protein
MPRSEKYLLYVAKSGCSDGVDDGVGDGETVCDVMDDGVGVEDTDFSEPPPQALITSNNRAATVINNTLFIMPPFHPELPSSCES